MVCLIGHSGTSRMSGVAGLAITALPVKVGFVIIPACIVAMIKKCDLSRIVVIRGIGLSWASLLSGSRRTHWSDISLSGTVGHASIRANTVGVSGKIGMADAMVIRRADRAVGGRKIIARGFVGCHVVRGQLGRRIV